MTSIHLFFLDHQNCLPEESKAIFILSVIDPEYIRRHDCSIQLL